ncbi:hypothetical protein Lal_00020952 [Lupinus albus]|nr:hypothetical protein Lal_00020952 [Lupinus albus]
MEHSEEIQHHNGIERQSHCLNFMGELFCLRIASQSFTASRLSLTLCTLTILAPPKTPAVTEAMVAGSLSTAAGLEQISPTNLFLEGPITNNSCGPSLVTALTAELRKRAYHLHYFPKLSLLPPLVSEVPPSNSDQCEERKHLTLQSKLKPK